jgi:hypothetical protein
MYLVILLHLHRLKTHVVSKLEGKKFIGFEEKPDKYFQLYKDRYRHVYPHTCLHVHMEPKTTSDINFKKFKMLPSGSHTQ